MKYAVIPAAGTGTRFGYLSKVLPKCLFPLYDRPIIAHILDHLKNLGIKQVVIIVGYKKREVISFISEIKENYDFEISFVEQNQPTGVADAIRLSEGIIQGNFIVILGDDVTFTKSLSNLVNLFEREKPVIVEGIVKETDIEKLKSACCLTINSKNMIDKIIEKPQKPFSDIRGCGVYICSQQIFDHLSTTPLSQRGQREITDAIAILANKNLAYAEFINGINLNINSYDDLLMAWQIQKILGEYMNG